MIIKRRIILLLSPLVIAGLLATFNSAVAYVPPFGIEGLGFEAEGVAGVREAAVQEVVKEVAGSNQQINKPTNQQKIEDNQADVANEIIAIGEEQSNFTLDLEALAKEQASQSFAVAPFAPSRVLGTSTGKIFGELQRLNLDGGIVSQGFALATRDDEFRIGLDSGAQEVPLVIVLKRIPAGHLPEGELVRVSDIYEFDVREQVGNTTESLGVLQEPINIEIKFSLETLNKKIVHFWNSLEQRWVPLPSETDFYGGYTAAKLNLPFARVALFNDPDIYEGWASWYRQFNGHYAASTIFPRGTQLKVTNLSGSPRHGASVDIKVNDYGPDPAIHPDRVIDLDTHAYEHIAASLKSGLMPVRVEQIK